jgi:hypothetical protein
MQGAPISLLRHRANVPISRPPLAQQQRIALEGTTIPFANLPLVVQRQNTKTRDALVVGVMRDERNVEPHRARRRPRIRPFDRLSDAEPRRANG